MECSRALHFIFFVHQSYYEKLILSTFNHNKNITIENRNESTLLSGGFYIPARHCNDFFIEICYDFGCKI